MTGVRIERVTADYCAAPVLADLSLDVASGEVVAVLGASGSGKTTLLRVLAGFLRPSAGEVRFGDRVVSGPSEWVPPERRRVSHEHYARHLVYADPADRFSILAIVWDRGHWKPVHDAKRGYAKGHLIFELHGKKMHGRWHLVRSGKPARQPQWLLFKDRDDYAGTLEADGKCPVPGFE